MSFADLHRPGDPFLLPNAWDFASGAILARQGFRAIATTSLGVAIAAGLPDGQGVAREETARVASRLRRLPVYLTVDLEQGFSDDPESVAEFVAGLGVEGVNLEDGLDDPDLLCRKIRAVKRAAPAVFVNARTDTYWLGRPSLVDTRRRLDAYVEAGADGVFVPGLQDPATIESLVGERPLNILLARDGLSLRQLAELGVARVSTGSLLFRMALGTLQRWAAGEADAAEPPSYAEVDALTRGAIEAPGE
ncbi:MAG TPA: isocitrate lyase/phosphoenolpyruvate mutase family protein [Candidatus Limnocylindrales bacterium]